MSIEFKSKFMLLQKLKENIGNAKHLVLLNGETIPAGIKSIDETNKTVTYYHGQGLSKIKQATDAGQPLNPILENPENCNTKHFSEIKDLV